MHIRPLAPSDYESISPVLDEWWGGRPVRHLLPRLFFEHFAPTSFALAEGQNILAFLVGFRSQSQPHIAYIHFVGVSPVSRGKGHGRLLYSKFFEAVSTLGCTQVQCITSPANTASIAFHQRMGFNIVSTGSILDGIQVSLNHGGDGQHRVLFQKDLPPILGAT
jgi:N-acetylglutamate synthase-like GNAT family acetyltransferase